MMGCDMVVARGRASVGGRTLFGQNYSGGTRSGLTLQLVPGRSFAPGEKVRTRYLELPQARQTFTVLASQVPGQWGFVGGVNERGVGVGCAAYPNKLTSRGPALTGPDLVRLVLERGHSAQQGVELIAELLERHGQGEFPGCQLDAAADHAILIGDATEAYLVETAAGYWVYQTIEEVRAVSNVCTIRQDWNRIAPGLSSYAIDQGWWPGDGSKLDFADALSAAPVGSASALRRWGRATLLLEQQNGHIDEWFLRRLLGDHYEGTNFEIDPLAVIKGPAPLCQHGNAPGAVPTAASLIAALEASPARLPMAGCAFGPPCMSIYFPLFLEGSLPKAFTTDSMFGRSRRLNDLVRARPALWSEVHARMAEFQEELDGEADELAVAGADLKRRGEATALDSLASSFVQRNLEAFDTLLIEFGVEHRFHAPRPIALGVE